MSHGLNIKLRQSIKLACSSREKKQQHVQTQEQSTFRHGVDESLQPLWTLTAQSRMKEQINKQYFLNKTSTESTGRFSDRMIQYKHPCCQKHNTYFKKNKNGSLII